MFKPGDRVRVAKLLTDVEAAKIHIDGKPLVGRYGVVAEVWTDGGEFQFGVNLDGDPFDEGYSFKTGELEIAVKIFFVLNGLLNGERGVYAAPAGGGNEPITPDGWYYLKDGDDEGVGPFNSREDAVECEERGEVP